MHIHYHRIAYIRVNNYARNLPNPLSPIHWWKDTPPGIHRHSSLFLLRPDRRPLRDPTLREAIETLARGPPSEVADASTGRSRGSKSARSFEYVCLPPIFQLSVQRNKILAFIIGFYGKVYLRTRHPLCDVPCHIYTWKASEGCTAVLSGILSRGIILSCFHFHWTLVQTLERRPGK